ncbi:MAG: hypothetical protein VXY77_01680 [Pseudomonadota bacterium]|nr:hypothetical protein [Pseudomonadota bacterium]
MSSKHLICILATALACCSAVAATLCSPTDLSIRCILQKQTGNLIYILQFLMAMSYTSGFGFIVAAIFKFKQVRENPQQVPVSTPLAFLLCAMLLLFLPGLIQQGGVTLFNVGSNNESSQQSLSGSKAYTLRFISTSDISFEKDSIPFNSDRTIYGTVRRVTNLFPLLTRLIIGGAYIAGLGFAVAALYKLKATRDNPQQNPIAVPIAYLFIAVLLMYMPHIVKPTAITLFGASGSSGSKEAGIAGQNYSTILSVE